MLKHLTTNASSILVCALPPYAALGKKPGRLVTSILKKQRKNTVRRDRTSDVANCCAIVGVRPKILNEVATFSKHNRQGASVVVTDSDSVFPAGAEPRCFSQVERHASGLIEGVELRGGTLVDHSPGAETN